MLKKKLAIFISGNGSNLQAIIDACKDDEYPCIISKVICNNPDAYGIERARKHNIDVTVINHRDYKTRQEFDQAIDSCLGDIDIICLAGFMRLLTAEFTAKWQGRMVNIHPSLLPSFKGANAIADAYNYGVKITGCTTHYVTAEMDAGDIILQKAVNITKNDDIQTLANKIHKEEHKILPETLAILAKKLD